MGPDVSGCGTHEHHWSHSEPGAPAASRSLPPFFYRGPYFPHNSPPLPRPAVVGWAHLSGPWSFPLQVLPAGLPQGPGDPSVPHADLGSTSPKICISNWLPGLTLLLLGSNAEQGYRAAEALLASVGQGPGVLVPLPSE